MPCLRGLRSAASAWIGAFSGSSVPELGRASGLPAGMRWGDSPRGLRPRAVQLRGDEFWVLFGPEVSHFVLAGTPVRVQVLGTGLDRVG